MGLTACGTSRPGGGGGPSTYANVECAPYARAVSGLQLFGDAASWWDQADGRYVRATTPSLGSVLVFDRSPRLPYGHVSVVAALSGPRAIEVTQANWVHHRVAQREPVVDVSPGNDWSEVRVWWEPVGQLGSTVYSTLGFVGPGEAAPADRIASAR